MKEVVMYSKGTCPYCIKAKELLNRKNIAFKEIDLTDDDEGRTQLVIKANGKRTVPQIFIGDYHVGGCDDLHALEEAGKLDSMLN